MSLNAFLPLATRHLPLAKEALRSAVMQLQQAKIESASLDARLLLEKILGLSREQMLFRMDAPLTLRQQLKFNRLVAKRAKRQPMAQILGNREFFGRNFKVTQATLDPRPDSETLIEAVLKAHPDRAAGLRILDFGTGTGCLLLTLLSEFPNATGVGADVCPKALAVARENAMGLGLSARAQFIESCWGEKVEGPFDMVVSNPPYIRSGDIPALAPEVAQHEPMLALDGGTDGLDCYRAIVPLLPALLKKGGMAAFEFGFGQISAVAEIVVSCQLSVVSVKEDLGGIPRCIILSKNECLTGPRD